jgi:hypothetical protein
MQRARSKHFSQKSKQEHKAVDCKEHPVAEGGFIYPPDLPSPKDSGTPHILRDRSYEEYDG